MSGGVSVLWAIAARLLCWSILDKRRGLVLRIGPFDPIRTAVLILS
jgi:hypothetical protein